MPGHGRKLSAQSLLETAERYPRFFKNRSRPLRTRIRSSSRCANVRSIREKWCGLAIGRKRWDSFFTCACDDDIPGPAWWADPRRAADIHESARQRHQVHGRGTDRTRGGDNLGGRGRPSAGILRKRYRHRHRRRQAADHIRSISPGRDGSTTPEVWRHRFGSRHLFPVGGDDGRPDMGGEQGRLWKHVPRHRQIHAGPGHGGRRIPAHRYDQPAKYRERRRNSEDRRCANCRYWWPRTIP